MNYYNEFEPHAAAWLRELIAEGLIPSGIVDTRSIEDVHPSDLSGFTQCHFFAGIGGWSLALAIAGWPSDRAVWTGSCPCQPFSAAGAGAGFSDERHLWPAFFHLIAQCRPAAVFGEQVASAAVGPWIDLVHADLEAVDYAFGSVAFPAAGVGAPHIRDRTYWVANAESPGSQGRHPGQGNQERWQGPRANPRGFCAFERLADGNGVRFESESVRELHYGECHAEPCGGVVGLADPFMQQRSNWEVGIGNVDDTAGRKQGAAEVAGLRHDLRPGPVNGPWRAADWLGCRDGKWRPVEPGTFPLAHGLPARVGRLRGYGNAIVPQAAAEFVRAFLWH